MVQCELGFDRLGGGGPDEGLWVFVGGGDVAGDRRFEVVDRAEDAPSEALPGQLGEEPSAFAIPRCFASREPWQAPPSTAFSQEQEVGVK